MPKSKETRTLTGLVRKEPRRDVQEQYRCTHGLNALEVQLRTCYQQEMASGIEEMYNAHDAALSASVLAQVAAPDNEIDELMEQADMYLNFHRNDLVPIYQAYEVQESQLCDVPQHIHDTSFEYKPVRKRTINSLTDWEADHYFGFTKDELRRIANCFSFPFQPRIHCSQNHYYSFTGEEIMLFGISKCRQGWDNITACDLFFGGSPRRWSNGYKYFLTYLYDRYYEKVLSFQGLSKVVDMFPYYARQIAKKFNQERFYLENHTFQRINIDSTVVDEEEFRIAGFIDGCVQETTTVGTGPNGDYEGTMRKDDAYIKQRAIYSGYKKQHGLSCLTIMTPPGIHYIYGPCSMRSSDVTMVNLSDVDNFLEQLQQHFDPNRPLFAFYGDRLFPVGRCITHAHIGDAANPLTRDEELENNGMNSVRVTIENGYAMKANQQEITERYREFKLDVENPHAKEQLAICYLMTNIAICLHGSQMASTGTFNCFAPTLEEYLAI